MRAAEKARLKKLASKSQEHRRAIDRIVGSPEPIESDDAKGQELRHASIRDNACSTCGGPHSTATCPTRQVVRDGDRPRASYVATPETDSVETTALGVIGGIVQRVVNEELDKRMRPKELREIVREIAIDELSKRVIADIECNIVVDPESEMVKMINAELDKRLKPGRYDWDSVESACRYLRGLSIMDDVEPDPSSKKLDDGTTSDDLRRLASAATYLADFLEQRVK